MATAGETDARAIRPAGGEHAIEVMALAVEWAEPLNGEMMNAGIAAFKADPKLVEQLPTERRFPAFEVKLVDESASLAPKDVAIADFGQFTTDNRVVWSLSFRPEFFACTCGVYDRWHNVKPKALGFLVPVVQAVLDVGAKIQAVGLQYSDALRWHRAKNRLDEAVRVNSPLLPASVFQRSSLWHTHNGWFSTSRSGHRLLNIVNIDLVDEGDARLLKVDGQHRLQATDDAGNSRVIDFASINAIADELHLANKLALQELFTDAVLNQIKFEKVPV